MAANIVLESAKDDIFVCGHCKSVFYALQLFLDHKSSPCGTDESNVSKLAYNIVTHSKGALTSSKIGPVAEHHSCTVCNKQFKKLNCLQVHLKLHSHDKTAFQCPICGRCFDYNSHLKRHIATHKVWPDGLTKTTPKSAQVELCSYSCSYCDSVLSNYTLFRAHLSCHLSLKKFMCIQSNCDGFFDTVEELLYHVSIAHCEPKYTCHKCKQPFQSLEEIADHQCGSDIIKMNQIQQFKCSLCDAIFRKSENLSLHMLTETHNKACIHCNKTFPSDKRLRLHLQVHKTCKPYHCNICNSIFRSKKYLNSHLLKHGERRYICMVCNHSFKRQDVLNRHIKTHLLRKHFKCPFKELNNCTKEFSRKDKLNQHIKSHTKHIKNNLNNSKQKISNAQDNGTVEICIVPLDNDIDNSE